MRLKESETYTNSQCYSSKYKMIFIIMIINLLHCYIPHENITSSWLPHNITNTKKQTLKLVQWTSSMHTYDTSTLNEQNTPSDPAHSAVLHSVSTTYNYSYSRCPGSKEKVCFKFSFKRQQRSGQVAIQWQRIPNNWSLLLKGSCTKFLQADTWNSQKFLTGSYFTLIKWNST